VTNSNRIDFLIKDNLCQKAIDDFKTLTSVPDWLNQHLELYESVTYQPGGLPRITNSNLGDESFENIQLFANLYELVDSLFD
jgi:hypothetical protein